MEILLVDDSATMRRIQKNLLAKLGYTDTIEAENGVSAQIKLEHADVDLILLDWNMPTMNGLTFLKSIRERGIRTPVIMVTAERQRENVLAAMRAGADAYVIKPFTPDVLTDRITAVMGKDTNAAEACSVNEGQPPDRTSDVFWHELTARDVMTARIVAVGPETTIFEAIRLLIAESISGVPVLDDGGQVVGVITEKDLLVGAHMLEAEKVHVSFIMTRNVLTVTEGTRLRDVIHLLLRRGFKQLPVVSDGRLTGIIARRDILRVIGSVRWAGASVTWAPSPAPCGSE